MAHVTKYLWVCIGVCRALVTLALLGGLFYVGVSSVATAREAPVSPVPRAANNEPALAVTVTGADNRWHNRDVVLQFTPGVSSPELAAIEVRVDGGEIESYSGSGCRRVIAAPTDHSGDGEHLIEFRGRDMGGDTGEWGSVTVRIDTRPPTGVLLHAVGVMRTTTARIDFRVDDESPGSGAADVTLAVRTRGGKLVQKLQLRAQRAGKSSVAKFSCRLPSGFYRIRMKTRDLAGNEAVAVSERRLVVTRWMALHRFKVPIVPLSKLAFVTGTPRPLVDNGPHDRQGVRMYRTPSGQLREYPGGQARYGLANLNSYRLTGNVLYLTRATAQARRLLKTRVKAGQGWFYPQGYSRYRHATRGTAAELMVRPWYGGMAQGQIVSFMVAMYQTTGETKYLTAARYTLNGLLRFGPRSGPWVTNVDRRKQFWIQEWPKPRLDDTYNGFMIASFGIYEYYRETGDSLALLLFRAAASTALDNAARFRNPGRPSVYCLLHRTINLKYHFVHVACLRRLAIYTGDDRFSRMASTFIRDYPGAAKGESAARAAQAVEAGVDLTAEDAQQAP